MKNRFRLVLTKNCTKFWERSIEANTKHEQAWYNLKRGLNPDYNFLLKIQITIRHNS
jgi:hypothetical protein